MRIVGQAQFIHYLLSHLFSTMVYVSNQTFCIQNDWVCEDDYKPTMIHTVFWVGNTIGCFLWGFTNDLQGTKKKKLIIIFCSSVQSWKKTNSFVGTPGLLPWRTCHHLHSELQLSSVCKISCWLCPSHSFSSSFPYW